MKRFNKMSRAKHSTPFKYHSRELYGVLFIMCWNKNTKACTIDILGASAKKKRYEHSNVVLQNKRDIYTSRWKKK